jgi:hypothetical protein
MAWMLLNLNKQEPCLAQPEAADMDILRQQSVNDALPLRLQALLCQGCNVLCRVNHDLSGSSSSSAMINPPLSSDDGVSIDINFPYDFPSPFANHLTYAT